MTDCGVFSISEPCPHLESIDIAYQSSSNITDESVIKIAETYPNLLSLNLYYCSLITNEVIIG